MNFHEIRFPTDLSFGSIGGPERRTEIVSLTNGFEERNSPWAQSRRRYDAGFGMRSLDDLSVLIGFFEARLGQLFGFRWKDWADFKSCLPSEDIDAVAQMRVRADDWESPSAVSTEGEAHVVGPIASNEWAGQSGKVAIFSNDGWVLLTPKIGWRAWNEALGAEIVFDGVEWVRYAEVFAVGGATTLHRVVEIDHMLAAAGVSVTSNVIPSHAQVIGVTARVTTAITGAGVSSWSLGVSGATDRYGSGLGLGLNASAKGATGPLTYWADTELEITADAGSFDGGIVRLAVHFMELEAPRAV